MQKNCSATTTVVTNLVGSGSATSNPLLWFTQRVLGSPLLEVYSEKMSQPFKSRRPHADKPKLLFRGDRFAARPQL